MAKRTTIILSNIFTFVIVLFIFIIVTHTETYLSMFVSETVVEKAPQCMVVKASELTDVIFTGNPNVKIQLNKFSLIKKINAALVK